MLVLKSTQEIFYQSWEYVQTVTTAGIFNMPPKLVKDGDPEIDDIVIWEQIFYEPGLVGIYAAWSPYANCYIISYDLFQGTSAGMEFITGKDATEIVVEKAKKLGIDIQVESKQIN